MDVPCQKFEYGLLDTESLHCHSVELLVDLLNEQTARSSLDKGMPSTNLKTSLEHAAFFLRRSKIGAAKQTKEQQFAKLPSSRFDELTELYNEHTPRHNKAKLDKVAHLLVQILQVQEVQTIKEYTLNGYTFKVHVLEDTEL